MWAWCLAGWSLSELCWERLPFALRVANSSTARNKTTRIENAFSLSRAAISPPLAKLAQLVAHPACRFSCCFDLQRPTAEYKFRALLRVPGEPECRTSAHLCK